MEFRKWALAGALILALGGTRVMLAQERFFAYPNSVKDKYIVVVEDKDATHIQALATALSKQYDGKVLATFTEVLGGFAVEMSESRARALSRVPGIASVHEVTRNELTSEPAVSVTTNPATSWGLDRIDQRVAVDLYSDDNGYTYYYEGTSVTVYFIDSGVNIVGDLVGRMSPNDKLTFINVANGAPPTIDSLSDCVAGQGHGTAVASTIGGATYGVARKVRLVSFKANSGNCGGSVLETIRSLQWIAANHNGGANGPAVVNISMLYVANTALDEAVRDTVAAGVTVVVGAGNTGQDACNYSPGRTGNPLMIQNNPNQHSAITVAASDRDDKISVWNASLDSYRASNTGACVDIFAPGGPGLTAQGKTGVTNAWEGTSAASPHVAGIAALTLAKHGPISPSMVWAAIFDNSTKDVITSTASGTILPGTPRHMVLQVFPPRRRPCCS